MSRTGCHDVSVRTPGVPSFKASGFTLIELMVVLALVALVTALVAMGARPNPQEQLQQEGERLAVWLESVRAQARVENQPIVARLTPSGAELWGTIPPVQPRPVLPWLWADTHPIPATLILGPEPILPPQSAALLSHAQAGTQVRLATSGVGPWRVAR
ncbi:MAG: prepilin-type N-terminal cleavage/methylation domain-containing protein [Alphaproteobacteria bacterium]|nr:prepilin-type N-terminal cleavage/methylation domain-containing protein [Alphaproteobacteria bacterium]